MIGTASDRRRHTWRVTPVTLVHENEKGIFGDIGRRCLDLMKSVNSPKLRCAFDFANFVQVGEKPLDNWALAQTALRTHIHIKDAKIGTGQVVPMPAKGMEALKRSSSTRIEAATGVL